MYHAFLGLSARDAPAATSGAGAIAHAISLLRENDRALEAFLQPRVDAARAPPSGAPLERFDALPADASRKRPHTGRAELHAISRLPAIEFVDRSHYPWLDASMPPPARSAPRRSRRSAQTPMASCRISRSRRARPSSSGAAQQLQALSTYFLIRTAGRWTTISPSARVPRRCCAPRRSAKSRGTRRRHSFPCGAAHTHPAAHRVTNTRFIVHLPLVGRPAAATASARAARWRRKATPGVRRYLRARGVNDSDQAAIVLIFDV